VDAGLSSSPQAGAPAARRGHGGGKAQANRGGISCRGEDGSGEGRVQRRDTAGEAGADVAAHSPAPATAGWLLPGPGWPWVLAAVTSVWQCGHVSTGTVMFPHVSWTSRTGGPPGVGAH